MSSPRAPLPPGHWISSKEITRRRLAARVLFFGFASIFGLSGLAMVTQAPWIFPSLGATAFLLFSAPETAPASPRNALLGHGIAILCGYGALLVTGLVDAPAAINTGVDLPRAVATSLSLGTCGALMLLLDTPHAPAGATALIVSLGLVAQPVPANLLIVEGAVALLVATAFAVHRMRGRAYPLWK